MIEQPPRVLGHQLGAVDRLVVELFALAMPPVVERHDTVARARQHPHPARIDPIGHHVRREAVDQQDGLARAFVDIGDLDAV